MTPNTVRGYSLTNKIAYDGSNPYVGESPDGTPVFIRLSAARVADAKGMETLLQFLSCYGQLSHPSLIKVRDSWIENGYLALVTDLADGGCLKDRLRRQGPFAARELVSLFRPLGEATDFLHRHGIRHRDIRPTNLLLRRGVPHLDVPRFRHFPLGVVVFNPSYSAPEVLRDEEPPQSDQYSLAASYVELRLGRPIFANGVSGGISSTMASLEREPDLQPLPERERDVLRKALAKDPAQRHPTCLAFVEELERGIDRVSE